MFGLVYNSIHFFIAGGQDVKKPVCAASFPLLKQIHSFQRYLCKKKSLRLQTLILSLKVPLLLHLFHFYFVRSITIVHTFVQADPASVESSFVEAHGWLVQLGGEVGRDPKSGSEWTLWSVGLYYDVIFIYLFV